MSIPHPEHVEAIAEKLSLAAAIDHQIAWENIPADIQQAFLRFAFAEANNLLRDSQALAVRVGKSGWWSLSVRGNPVIVADALKDAFPAATAPGPSTCWLRPVRESELDCFDGSMRDELAAIIADDLANPWGVDIFGRGEQCIWSFPTREAAQHACRTAMSGAFAATAKPTLRTIDR